MKRKRFSSGWLTDFILSYFILSIFCSSFTLFGATQNIDGVVISKPALDWTGNSLQFKIYNTNVIYQTRHFEGRLRSIYTPLTVGIDSSNSALMIHGELVSVPTFTNAVKPGLHGHFYEDVFVDMYLTPNHEFGIIHNHDPVNNEIDIMVARTPKNGHFENNPDTLITVKYTDQTQFFIEDNPSTETEALEKFGKWIQIHPPRNQIIWLETELSAYDYARLPHYDNAGRMQANSASGMAYLGDFTEDGSSIRVTRKIHDQWVDTTHTLSSPQAWLNGKLCPTAVAFKPGRTFAACCRRSGIRIKEEMVRVRDDEIRGTIIAIGENSFTVEAMDWDRNMYTTTIDIASNSSILLDGIDTTTIAIEVGQKVRIFPEHNTKRIIVLNERISSESSHYKPIAYFHLDKANGVFNQEFTFDGSHSYDLDGTITSYSWSFGDGQTASGEVVTHSFVNDSSSYEEYKVTLTVSNDEEETASYVRYITVVNQMRKAENLLKGNLHQGMIHKEWLSACDYGTYPDCENPDVYEVVNNTIMETNGGMNEFSAYINVPEDGWYEFRLPGYDLQLWIGDWLVVDNINRRDNWGIWGLSMLKGMAYLEAGLHPITFLTKRDDYWHNLIGWSGPGVKLRAKTLDELYGGGGTVTRTRFVLDEDVYYNPADHNMPTANIAVSKTRANVPVQMDMDASASTGTIHVYNWYLFDYLTGDSIDQVEGQVNEYVFETPGLYHLVLHVLDTIRNFSSVDSVLITINDTTFIEDKMGISVSFSSHEDPPLLPSYAVGDMPLLNWNNYQRGLTENNILQDSRFKETSLRVKDIDMSSHRNNYLDASMTNTGDEIMRHWSLKPGSVPLPVTNIPPVYWEQGYDLYVYPVSSSGNIFRLNIGTDTFWIKVADRGSIWDGEYVLSTARTQSEASDGDISTHVIFENLTSDSLSISMSNSRSAGFAGIQIVTDKVESGMENRIDQNIFFDKINDKLSTDVPFHVYAHSSSNLMLDYQILSGPATISDNLITLEGFSGIVEVQVSHPGNDQFNPVQKVQTFHVTDPEKSDQTINFVPVSDKVNTHDDFEVVAMASSGLDVVMDVVEGPATMTGNVIQLTGGVGFVTIRAIQQGNDVYNPAPMQLERFNVTEELQPAITLTFPYTNSVFREGETVTLTAAVELGEETLEEVAFYEGNNMLGAVSNSPYIYEWENLQRGSYTLSARLTTSEGTDIYSQGVNITVDHLLENQVVRENTDFLLSPNPTTGLIYLDILTSFDTPLRVEVYTILGEKILSRQLNDEASLILDLSDEAHGIYLVKVGNSIRKVVKR